MSDSLESSGLNGNEVERQTPRVGILESLGLPDKKESNNWGEISETSLNNVEKKVLEMNK